MHARPDFFGIACDITRPVRVRAALERALCRFGGLDMLVLNAGMFPGGTPIRQQRADEWRRVMSVNLDANQALMQACHPLLQFSPRHGRVVVVGSKNVRAPGLGASAYSASKAGLTQLARVAALEWAADGIRVNVVHPDAVFDTDLWTENVLKARAEHYGISVEQYRTRNLLRTEVRSRDVAAMVCAMCSDVFGRTTGAQIPVDGGNDRVI
jgi:NAD(P)-dependent dehydrogenase (short-subunit alcohol dehydrogenase family)